jgi:hypothetical protein
MRDVRCGAAVDGMGGLKIKPRGWNQRALEAQRKFASV